MRTVWSDERLDDLNHKVDDLRSELSSFRGEVNEFRSEVNVRFDSMQRSFMAVTATTLGTMVVGFASILATQL